MISKEFLQKRTLPRTVEYRSRKMHRGRGTFHYVTHRCLRSLAGRCLRLRHSPWNDNSFLRIATFFSSSSGSSRVKSISVRIGEKFMRRCAGHWSGGLHGAYCGPFLACAIRVSWPPSLGVFERMYTGQSQSVEPSSSRPTHFTRVNRNKIYRRPCRPRSLRPVSFARRICVHVGVVSRLHSFVRSPFPLSLRKSFCAFYLANHDATFTGPTLIGSVRDALYRVMDFFRISRDWNTRNERDVKLCAKTGCEPIERTSREVIISRHANLVCVIWNVSAQLENDF